MFAQVFAALEELEKQEAALRAAERLYIGANIPVAWALIQQQYPPSPGSLLPQSSKERTQAFDTLLEDDSRYLGAIWVSQYLVRLARADLLQAVRRMFVFVDTADEAEGRMLDNLNCPCCGGSGHVEDCKPDLAALEAELKAARFMAKRAFETLVASNKALTAEREKVAALAEMVEMMDSGEEHGGGSAWHVKARAAIDAARNNP